MRPLLAALLVLSPAATAAAHPRIDEARAAYEQADLEAATRALDEAFDLGNLTRDEYLTALVLRALVASARRLNATRDDALRQIGAIDPGYVLPDEAPPSLRARYAEILAELGGERVAAQLEVRREGERFNARIQLADPVRVVARTSIVCRAGEDVFQSEGRDAFGLVPAWRSLDCVGRLLGRGGTILEEIEERAPGDGSAPEPAPIDGGGGDDALAIGLGLGIGAAVAAAVTVILVFVLTAEEEPPTVIPSNRYVLPGGFTPIME